ncbi:MAG: hypothetical protein AAGD96_22620 [Chloroflexota bacterium]
MIPQLRKNHHLIACGLLLLAFLLRVYQLDSLPPGLTHDEANHGHEAIEVLNGIYRYYFPLGYGREPFYAYLLAGWMGVVGVSPFTLRLLIVMGMVVTHAAVYCWVDKLFSRKVALLSLAILAVGWWPLVASRQALRSGLLPLITIGLVAGTYAIWDQAQKEQSLAKFFKAIRWPVISIAVLIGFMLHTYIAARVLWVFIPALGIYLLLINVQVAKRFWMGATPAVAGGLLLSAPLFIYLQNNPGLETRLEMLDGPINAFLSGDVLPVLENSWGAFLGIIWPGRGDQFLAYNIPSKQTLAPLTAVFFLLGILKSLIRWHQPKYMLLLLWLGVGLAPSLITGPTAATTRSIGALIPIYLLAALGICLFNTNVIRAFKLTARHEMIARGSLFAVWIASAAYFSVPSYFIDWGQRPDVRAAYQVTMIDALTTVFYDADGTQVVSSVLPGHAHDPTIAEVVLGDEANDLRWVDGRRALIIPAETDPVVHVLAPSSAGLHPAFTTRHSSNASPTQLMRPDDLDPSWSHVTLQATDVEAGQLANFNQAIVLQKAEWLAEGVSPNGVAELYTEWAVLDPTKLGGTIPYVGYPDTNMFVHILSEDGTILTQVDQLDAPSWAWRPGDRILHVHQIYIGPDTELGEYAAVIGVYDRLTGNRLSIIETDDTTFLLPSLEVRN